MEAEKSPLQCRRRGWSRGCPRAGAETPGGSALSVEKAGPDANDTPRGTKGHHPGDRPDKPAGGGGRKWLPSRRERTLEGEKPRGGSGPRGGQPRRVGQRTSGGINTGQPGKVWRGTVGPLEPTARRQRLRRKARRSPEGRNLRRAEPHERHRSETGPEGAGRIKPSGGWETLKADGSDEANPASRFPAPRTLKGHKPHGSGCASQEARRSFRSYSEEESKSRRG